MHTSRVRVAVSHRNELPSGELDLDVLPRKRINTRHRVIVALPVLACTYLSVRTRVIQKAIQHAALSTTIWSHQRDDARRSFA